MKPQKIITRVRYCKETRELLFPYVTSYGVFSVCIGLETGKTLMWYIDQLNKYDKSLRWSYKALMDLNRICKRYDI